MKTNIGKLKLKNPVMVASGTFGYAEEFKDFVNLAKLGAIVTKTITLKPKSGNQPPRTCETPAGMLNSIGLENPGIEAFVKENLPKLRKIGAPIIVSISSVKNPREFITLANRLDRIKEVSAIELNISCPNIKNLEPRTYNLAPRLISQDARATYRLVKSVRRVTKKTLITKLSPNVTDIVEIAQAAKRGGSDAIALINTISGMGIDVDSRQAKLAAVTGGLSGPAIRPIAIKMVWEVYNKVKIPVIGMGGIMDLESALEFFIAGATAISIGTANFINPKVSIEIIQGLNRYLRKHRIKDIKKLIGSLKR
ncbi:MAG: dihydroorotate dehydrogenase [Candidatus Omnitrophota bacterium]